MTPEAARSRLRANTQATVEPVLTDLELDDLLLQYSMADAAGIAPGELGWIGTYDLRAASRAGWLLKAAKVTAQVTYSADGSSYNLSDMHANCLRMADRYHSAGSIRVGAS